MADENEKVRLTQFSHGAGCGCKIAPQVLEEILRTDQIFTTNKNLLVGNSSNDDAAVYDMGNGTAIISTTDFFTPIVDDAFDFGRIASANALSDVYAMGGKPLLAIAVLGWPVEKLSPQLAQQVIEGSRSICEKAGVPLAGGHSIDSPEPFFGLAVTGMVNIEHLKKNNTAQEGDLIFITKPIGVGILSTAQKRDKITADDQQILTDQLTQLNSLGELLGNEKGVTAMTDVTGFGLAGHLIEMADGSGLSAELYYSKVPVLAGAQEYLKERIVPDATYRNWNAYSKKISFEKGVNVMEAFSVLPDPQTNGGLLIAVRPEATKSIQKILRENSLENFVEPIGKFVSKNEKSILVLNSDHHGI